MTEVEFQCPKCGEAVAARLDGRGVVGWECPQCGEKFSRDDSVVARPPSSDSLAGGRLGTIEIKEMLGTGGLGTVYRGWDSALPGDVAVKVLHRSRAEDPEFVRRYVREMITAAQLYHPNIVRIYKVGRDEDLDLHFVVMEWTSGESLDDRIHRDGPLPAGDATGVILQCADGLQSAHRKGVFHGDIKPANILLDAGGAAKLTDFGITGLQVAEGDRAKVAGTPLFMAPERFEGRPFDEQSDIYSLGVTFYRAVSGETPFRGETPVEIIHSILTGEPRSLPHLPEDVWRIIARMIAKDRSVRYSELEEVRADLRSLDSGRRPEREASRASGAEASEVGAYLGLGQFALAVSTLSEEQVLAPLDPAAAKVVTGVVRSLQSELTTTLLDLVERGLRDGEFLLAARHHETLLRVAAEDHPERPRIQAAQVRIEEFRARQRAAADPLIGHRLGHWVIEESLGEGAFGKVYRGQNVRLKQTVAIKILKRHLVEIPKTLALFEREARAAAKLDHPGIVRIYGLEFDEETTHHFLVLEFVDGRDLDVVLGRQPDGVLPLDFTLWVIRSSAEALATAHDAGILHRDIKPGNIMLLQKGLAKVGDFGLAREIDSDSTTTLKGTPPYMSPEQWNSKEDHRTDIYALGVSIYHLLSGKFPYPGSGYQIAMKVMTEDPNPLAEVRPDLPAEVSEFVGRMIAKLPARRPQSMGEVASEITDLAEGLALDLDGVPERHRRIFTGDETPEKGPEAPPETRTYG